MGHASKIHRATVCRRRPARDEKQSTHFRQRGFAAAGPTSPEENDSELRQLANRLVVTPKDLLLFRELMLERYWDRFSEENYPTPKNSEE